MQEESENETLVVEIAKQLDDRRVEFLFKSQCMKSQIYIRKKLEEIAKRQEQRGISLGEENIKLQTEIALANEEINSALKALIAIKDGNVQSNTANLNNTNDEERFNNGITKYETTWQTSEKQYQNIPIIHYSLAVKKKTDAEQENVNSLIDEVKQLEHDVMKQEKEVFELQKKYVIQLAKHFVHERPEITRQLRDKQNEIIEMRKESEERSTRFGNSRILKYASRIKDVIPTICDSKEGKDSWQSVSTRVDNKNDNAMLPLLQFNSQNFKTLSHLSDELNQLKKNYAQNTSIKNTKDIYKEHIQSVKPYEVIKNVYISTLLNNYNTTKGEDYEVNKNNKSIHILQDVSLNDAQAYEILSKAKGNSLQKVNKIGEDAIIDKSNNLSPVKEKPVNTVEITEILEVPSDEEQAPEIVLPPTQYKDQPYGQNSQQKRVTFDEDVSIRNFETIDLDKSVENDNIESQLNVSVASYTKMKEVELKKHNLDSTPPFVYSKNTITSMKHENKIVTSKFFDYINMAEENEAEKTEVNDEPDLKTKPMETDDKEELGDGDRIIVDKTETTQQTQNNLSGLIFNDNKSGIPESLEISMDYDDGDGEMPSFINTSLLLSPKADDPVPSTSDAQKPPMYNFFSGFKNNRSTFFGASPFQDKSEEPSKDENKKFPFSFGGDKKKSSGGFFNMFN